MMKLKIITKEQLSEPLDMNDILTAYFCLPLDKCLIIIDSIYHPYEIIKNVRKYARLKGISYPKIFPHPDGYLVIEKRDYLIPPNFFCDICKQDLRGHGPSSKYNHFQEYHPEYAFRRVAINESTYYQTYAYYCLTCNQRLSNFRSIKEHYELEHPEKLLRGKEV